MDYRELNADELRRYSRNIMLDEIGTEGQKKLLDASVLIIGSGALGSIASMYLAGAGVGKITVADFDTIDISNLQRQLSFEEEDIGKKKSEILASRLSAINSSIIINNIDGVVTPKMAEELISSHDFTIEATDNPASTYMICDLCKKHDKPCCIGGVSEFRGMVTTFVPGHTTYRDVFPEAAEQSSLTPCAIGGVLGPLPGIIGSIQATEAIKCITKAGRLLTDRLLTIDILNMDFRIFEI